MAGVSMLPTDSHISFLPLAHMFERIAQANNYANGVAVGFSRGNPLLLVPDIQELKPTVFVGVPRLYNRLYDKINAGINTSGSVKKLLFQTAYNAKKGNLVDHGSVDHRVWDKVVFAKIRAQLGGRVRLFVTGSAPIAVPVLQFLRICFSCNVVEGYGQTEASAACSLTNRQDVNASGHVGSPLACNEIKLVDVPEMNYRSTDTVKGVPYPRGEVWVRGANVFSGYYKDPANTTEALTQDNWLRTGDIGLWTPENNLKIIDRKKNIFKLSQGEYIAPEKIENVYVGNRFIAQIFVYGDSLQSTLVAIVVPDEEELKTWAKQNKIEFSDFKSLVNHHAVEPMLSSEMQATGVKGQLRGFEHVKAIHVTHELFSIENGILTPTMKLKRNEAKKRYQSEIDTLYKKIERSPAEKGSKTNIASKL